MFIETKLLTYRKVSYRYRVIRRIVDHYFKGQQMLQINDGCDR